MAKKRRVTYPRRGEVYLVDFDPTRGAEIRKIRPALIIQNDVGNRHSPVTIAAAITSTVPPVLPPFKVFVGRSEAGLSADSVILLNQIRAVDKERLIRRLGKLRVRTLAQVDRALKVSLGLIDL